MLDKSICSFFCEGNLHIEHNLSFYNECKAYICFDDEQYEIKRFILSDFFELFIDNQWKRIVMIYQHDSINFEFELGPGFLNRSKRYVLSEGVRIRVYRIDHRKNELKRIENRDPSIGNFTIVNGKPFLDNRKISQKFIELQDGDIISTVSEGDWVPTTLRFPVNNKGFMLFNHMWGENMIEGREYRFERRGGQIKI